MNIIFRSKVQVGIDCCSRGSTQLNFTKMHSACAQTLRRVASRNAGAGYTTRISRALKCSYTCTRYTCDRIIYRYRVDIRSNVTRSYTCGFCRGAITRDTMEYIGCKPINPPLYSGSSSRFWIFRRRYLYLGPKRPHHLRQRTPLTATKVTRVASDDDDDDDDSANKIVLTRIHAFRLCRLLRSQTDVPIRRRLSRVNCQRL